MLEMQTNIWFQISGNVQIRIKYNLFAFQATGILPQLQSISFLPPAPPKNYKIAAHLIPPPQKKELSTEKLEAPLIHSHNKSMSTNHIHWQKVACAALAINEIPCYEIVFRGPILKHCSYSSYKCISLVTPHAVSLEQPPSICLYSHFNSNLQETSLNTSLWLGLSPIDNNKPGGWLMLHNCFIDFFRWPLNSAVVALSVATPRKTVLHKCNWLIVYL